MKKSTQKRRNIMIDDETFEIATRFPFMSRSEAIRYALRSLKINPNGTVRVDPDLLLEIRDGMPAYWERHEPLRSS